jgi:hypothetical protein
MKRIAACTAGAALAFVLVTNSAWAGDDVSGVTGQRATTSEMAHGQVEAVDSTHNALTLSDGRQLALNPNAPVTKDGEVATLKDIQQGDDVWASFAPGSPPTVEGVDALTPARQTMDGIPTSNQQEFLHETWTSGG